MTIATVLTYIDGIHIQPCQTWSLRGIRSRSFCSILYTKTTFFDDALKAVSVTLTMKYYINKLNSDILRRLTKSQSIVKMARNEEKAMAMLNRWVKMKREIKINKKGGLDTRAN